MSPEEKQQPLPCFWPAHALEAFPSASAHIRALESGATGAEPAAGGHHSSSFQVLFSSSTYGDCRGMVPKVSFFLSDFS